MVFSTRMEIAEEFNHWKLLLVRGTLLVANPGQLLKSYSMGLSLQRSQGNDVGKGSFGKIRLAIAFTWNESCSTKMPRRHHLSKKVPCHDEKGPPEQEQIQTRQNDYQCVEWLFFWRNEKLYLFSRCVRHVSRGGKWGKKPKSLHSSAVCSCAGRVEDFWEEWKYFPDWQHQKNYLLTVFHSNQLQSRWTQGFAWLIWNPKICSMIPKIKRECWLIWLGLCCFRTAGVWGNASSIKELLQRVFVLLGSSKSVLQILYLRALVS